MDGSIAMVDKWACCCSVGLGRWYPSAWNSCRICPKAQCPATQSSWLWERQISKVKKDSFSVLHLFERHPWSVLPLEAMLISISHTAVGGHVDLGSLCCNPRQCWFPFIRLPLGTILVLMAQVPWSLSCYPQPVLLPRAVMDSMVNVVAESCVDDHDLYCLRR